jgi:hypothetical protein
MQDRNRKPTWEQEKDKKPETPKNATKELNDDKNLLLAFFFKKDWTREEDERSDSETEIDKENLDSDLDLQDASE